MKIRKATRKDFDSLLEFFDKTEKRGKKWAELWINKYLERDKLILLTIEKNKIVGYSFLDKKEEDRRINSFLDTTKFACISIIATDKNLRGKGIGSRLLRESEEYAKKWGKRGVWLDCRKEVISFYLKNKYSLLGYFIKIKNNNNKRRQYVLLKRIK
jgi:ribosomal protein S18 acetylase RimI-like enzyme